MSDLQDIRELSIYSLAGLADCGGPSSPTSEGATMLASVRDATIEAVEYAHSDGDRWADTLQTVRDGSALHEIADGAPSVYTYTRWQEFVDLAAWQEDVSELAGDSTDMEQLAGVALYMIAERLATAILDDLQEWADEMDAAAEDEDADDEDEDAPPLVADDAGNVNLRGADERHAN